MNKNILLNDDFVNFLVKAKTGGYASGGESSVKTKESDFSKTIEFSEGQFRYHDNYFGGEPYGGREVVFVSGRPAWMMVYYGRVLENADVSVKEIYKFLCQALKLMPKAAPFRGDKYLLDNDFQYINEWQGDIDNFSGKEVILFQKKVVYEASYMGGLIDLQKNV